MSLSLQMLIAALLGIFSGLFLGDLNALFSPWASAYIMVLKITAIPYLFLAIIHGVGQFTSNQAKEKLKKGIFYVGLAWSINIAMIYLLAFSLPKIEGTAFSAFVPQKASLPNFAELLIPENIFYSLSHNIIPAVVVFSLLVGIALIHIKDKQPTMDLLQVVIDTLTRITAGIGRITPIGTFLIIANQTGTIDPSTLKQLSTYIVLYILGISLVVFWIFPRIVSSLTPISAWRWVKDLFPVLILAFTTNLAIVCLPFIIPLIERESAALYPRDEKLRNQIQGTVSVIFNLPLGSLFLALFVLFISRLYSMPLGLGGQINMLLTTFLTGLGSIGIGTWINSLTFILDTLGLPLDSVDLFLTAMPFTAGFQSMLSIMEIASLALLTTFACQRLIRIRWLPLLKTTACTLILPLLFFGALQWHSPFPTIKSSGNTFLDLTIHSPVASSIAAPSSRRAGQETLSAILSSGVLRVGYNTHVMPFCFFNSNQQIVGYDIAFAYQLAADLGCKLELVPLNYANIVNELEQGIYDIGMSAITINEERLKNIAFSSAYSEGEIVFVCKSEERKRLSSLLKPLTPLRLAVLKNSSFEALAHKLFPQATIVPLDTYDAFATDPSADAILWSEQPAIAWTLLHPQFQIAFPNPSIGINSLGYAISPNSLRLKEFLDEWLKLKQNEGFTAKAHDKWILGKTTDDAQQTPRWSILRNVLHWIQ